MNITRKAAARQQMPTFTAADLSQLLGRPIAYHRIFAHLTNDPGAALFLSQALYWTPRATHTNATVRAEDGWFYKTQAEWWQETGLSRRNQETSRKRLKALGILEEQRRGQQGHIYFRLNLQVLAALLRALIDNESEQLEMADSYISKSTKRAVPDGAFVQLPSITETSTKTTSSPRAKKSAAAKELDDDDVETSSLVTQLVQAGATPRRAKLAVAANAEEMRRRLKYLENFEPTNAGAWLTSNPQEAYSAPQAQRIDEAEAKLAQERREAARRAADQRTAARRIEEAIIDEDATLDAQLAALLPDQRAQIEAEAQAERAKYAKVGLGVAPPLQLTMRNILRQKLKKQKN